MNNDDEAVTSKTKKSRTFLTIIIVLVVVAGLGVAGVLLLKPHNTTSTTKGTPHPKVTESYAAIKLPTDLQLLQHQSTTAGTPSEVYYYQYTMKKQNVTKGTDGLIFSATKNSTISLNFTFIDPDQIKVIAI
jgi:flagellar basal body-associated protein FliL